MIPQLLEADAAAAAVCDTSDRWAIHHELAWKLYTLAKLLPFPVSIISGHRTAAQQADLAESGATTAPQHLSTHTSCPATGCDIRVGVELTDQVKAQVGAAAAAAGLRWGGGAPRANGIPVGHEWAHLDLGPRQGS